MRFPAAKKELPQHSIAEPFGEAIASSSEVWKGPLRLNEEVLEEVLPNPMRAIFLVSGPPGLCRAADALRAMRGRREGPRGVRRKRALFLELGGSRKPRPLGF